KAQACDARNCVIGEPQFEVKLVVSAAAPVPLSPELKERLKAPPPELKVVELPLAPGSAPTPRSDAPETPRPAPSGEAQGKADASGLLAFILQGIIWGYISLLTPCVFPMIPITVSFFLKQSEKEHHNPLQMALIYSGTIVVVLTAGAVLLLRFF